MWTLRDGSGPKSPDSPDGRETHVPPQVTAERLLVFLTCATAERLVAGTSRTATIPAISSCGRLVLTPDLLLAPTVQNDPPSVSESQITSNCKHAFAHGSPDALRCFPETLADTRDVNDGSNVNDANTDDGEDSSPKPKHRPTVEEGSPEYIRRFEIHRFFSGSMSRFRACGDISSAEEKDEFKAMCATMIRSTWQVLELKAVTEDGFMELGVRRELVPIFREYLQAFEVDLKRRRAEEKRLSALEAGVGETTKGGDT